MGKPKFLRIKWEDACTREGWHRSKVKYGLVKVLSVGILVAKDKKDITLSLSVDENSNNADAITIPKSCILSKKVLK